MQAVSLLSGGMDSAVALFYVGKGMGNVYQRVDALFFNYGQMAAKDEAQAAEQVWNQYKLSFPNIPGTLYFVRMHPQMFFSNSSILNRSTINIYETVEDAKAGTPADRSYIPFRNGIFLAVAGHFLATKLEGSCPGDIITGVRGRADTSAAPGFADCTRDFVSKMHDALTVGTGKRVGILDVLNQVAPTREATLRAAQELPGCWAALAHTVSCFQGNPPCGHCLPCLRRAEAFRNVGCDDPALEVPHAG